MKKLIVIGHVDSGYESVFELLQKCGVEDAKPIQADGLTARDIGKKLCQAHGITVNAHQPAGKTLPQIKINPIWNSLIANLFLANLDSEIWGWADTNSIHLLEYWLAIDPEITLILVYDEPGSILRHNESGSISGETIKSKINYWINYNATLLDFHEHQSDRTILVHTQQVLQSVEKYFQELKSHTGIRLSEYPHAQNLAVDQTSIVMDREATSAPIHAHALATIRPPTSDINHTFGSLSEYLKKSVVATSRTSINLYKKLQESANLPLSNHATKSFSIIEAWEDYIHLQNLLSKQKQKIEQQSKSKAGIKDSGDDVFQRKDIKFLETMPKESPTREKETDDLQKRIVLLESRLQEAIDKNKELDLLKMQIRSLERGIEKSAAQAIDRARLKEKALDLQSKLNAALAKNNSIKSLEKSIHGAPEIFRKQESYQIGQLIIKSSKSMGGLLSIPFSVRKLSKEIRLGNTNKQPINLEAYEDFAETLKIKNHLSYKLGQAWIRNSGHILSAISIPVALIKESIKFKRNR